MLLRSRCRGLRAADFAVLVSELRCGLIQNDHLVLWYLWAEHRDVCNWNGVLVVSFVTKIRDTEG